MVKETVDRVWEEDPAWGDWCVKSMYEMWNQCTDWYKLPSDRSGARKGWSNVACWLQPTKNARHINLADLGAAIKCLNLALHWQAKYLHIKTDYLCVLLVVWHPRRQNWGTYQSSEWDWVQWRNWSKKISCLLTWWWSSQTRTCQTKWTVYPKSCLIWTKSGLNLCRFVVLPLTPCSSQIM